jgi:hypothetical protein
MKLTPLTVLLIAPMVGLHAADVKGFLETHCYDCHDADAKKGKFQVDVLPTEKVTPDSAKAWSRILARLESGDMPPPKKQRPPQAEVDSVLAWSKSQLAAEA